MSSQPGLEGEVPFTFECQRSGRCCSGGAGAVWVEEGEVADLAASLGLEPEVFRGRFLRTLIDPRSGEPRLSLRERAPAGGESGGPCALLEGRNECAVYEARPQHCRTFPFWQEILADPEVFASARRTCPGIRPERPAAPVERAAERLAALYEAVEREIAELAPRCELSGACCRFEEAGHELWATGLEVDYAVARHPEAPEPEAPGRCPYHVKGLCTAREGRPLGCRTYFCDPRHEQALQELHERYLREVRLIEREHELPASYGRFPAELARRGVGAK